MRTILITGATGGLAESIVSILPEDDGLILVGRSKERLDKKYGDLPNASTIAIDIKDATQIETLVEDIYNRYGQIDVLINNAGFGEFKNFDEFDAATIKEMFEVNTQATMHFSRLLGQKMKARGQGHIINIASMAGLMATAKSTVYSATKFAVIGFSNALRLELAESGVYVTTVNPGPISTSFFDQADPSGNYLKSVEKYTLTPEQVANRVVKAIGKNKRELNMPFALVCAAKAYSLFPKTADYLARKVFNYK